MTPRIPLITRTLPGATGTLRRTAKTGWTTERALEATELIETLRQRSDQKKMTFRAVSGILCHSYVNALDSPAPLYMVGTRGRIAVPVAYLIMAGGVSHTRHVAPEEPRAHNK